MEAETYTASSDATFPLRWTAPETLTMRMVSRASDVWSFAVALWEMIERKLPYLELPSARVIDFLNSGQRLNRPTKVEIPDDLWKLMLMCWNEIPAERPAFDTICTELRKIEEQWTQDLKLSSPQGHNGTFFTSSDTLIQEKSEIKSANSTDEIMPSDTTYAQGYHQLSQLYPAQPSANYSESAYGNAPSANTTASNSETQSTYGNATSQ